jgi:hypothetical protein
MKESLKIFFSELHLQSVKNKTDEFEFYVEILGLNWCEWGVIQNGIQLKFSNNDLDSEDINFLEKSNYITLIKNLEKGESYLIRKLYKISCHPI